MPRMRTRQYFANARKDIPARIGASALSHGQQEARLREKRTLAQVVKAMTWPELVALELMRQEDEQKR